jgi:hypothetical protein
MLPSAEKLQMNQVDANTNLFNCNNFIYFSFLLFYKAKYTKFMIERGRKGVIVDNSDLTATFT